MLYILGFVFIIWIFVYIPLIPCALFNIPFVIYYILYDLYNYIKDKAWKKFKHYGIRVFTGMFGKGKTLTATYYANKWYKKYGNSLLFLSNYKLNNIPYIPLVSFEQLVTIQEKWQKLEDYKYRLTEGDGLDSVEFKEYEKLQSEWKYQGVVVLIDEIELLLNNRKFSEFPLELLHTLCQQRKFKMVILATAQRFGMVDIAFRRISTFVVECNKLWRFQCSKIYDAWELENAVNPQFIKPVGRRCYFIRNKLFQSYDTTQSITRENTADFISNKESLEKKGYILSNLNVVDRLNRKGRKRL